MLRIEAAEEFRPPMQQLERVIDAELQPVQALGIAAEIGRRLYVIPGCVAVAVPGLPHDIERLVLFPQPLPQFAFGPIAVAVHLGWSAAAVRVLVPQIVAEERRMI